jgi:hypothetical protein
VPKEPPEKVVKKAPEHPLSTKRLGVVFAMVGPFAIGVWLMTLQATPPFVIGLIVVVLSMTGSIWIFADDWNDLFTSRQVRNITGEFRLAVLAHVIQVVVAIYVAVSFWPTAAPLIVSAEVGPGNYPENEPMGEIRWHPSRYAAARVRVTNDSSDDYTSVVLIVHSELLIEEMTEETGTTDCSILPDEDLSKMSHIGPRVVQPFPLKLNGVNGKQYLSQIPGEDSPWPKHLIAADKDYRIACDRVPGGRTFVLLAAIINPGPKLNPLNPPRPPHWIDVTAKYTANGRRLTEKIEFDCANGPCTIRRSRWRQRLDALFDGDC